MDLKSRSHSCVHKCKPPEGRHPRSFHELLQKNVDGPWQSSNFDSERCVWISLGCNNLSSGRALRSHRYGNTSPLLHPVAFMQWSDSRERPASHQRRQRRPSAARRITREKPRGLRIGVGVAVPRWAPLVCDVAGHGRRAINVIQRVTGHANAPTTLNRYAHAHADYADRFRGRC